MTKKAFVLQAIAFVLAWMALPFLLACDKGCEEHSGVCACDSKPEQTPYPEMGGLEKPRRGQQPEWVTGEIHADAPQSLIYEDAKQDEAKRSAESEGKKAAGL